MNNQYNIFFIELVSTLCNHGFSGSYLFKGALKERRNTGGLMAEIIISNVSVYAAIADEAFVDMEKRLEESRKLRSEGEGWIVSFDPSQKSFKSALIYIVFSALWLEAILHLRIADQHGKSHSKEVDRKSYEEKLAILGVDDREISCSLAAFRELRREIIHEKAFFAQDKFRSAQDEARKVRHLMQIIQEKLGKATD